MNIDAESLSLSGVPIYLYGLSLSVAVAALLLLAAFLAKKQGFQKGTVLLLGVIALPLGLFFARLFYCLISMGYFLETISQPVVMLYFWDGGLSMMGALMGGALAAWIVAKRMHIPYGKMMDVVAAAAGLFLAVARLGEKFTFLGRGKTILSDWMAKSLFFGIQSAWGDEIYYAVYRYEAVAALLILCAMLALFFGKKTQRTARPGDLCWVFVVLFGASQVIFESLRDDGHLLWGFVRASQVISILGPVAAIAVFSTRIARVKGMNWMLPGGWAVAAGSIALAVVKEFDIDTSNNLTREYIIMALAMASLAAVAMLLWKKQKAATLDTGA